MPSKGRRTSTAPALAWWTAWRRWPRWSIPTGVGIASRTERVGSHDTLVGPESRCHDEPGSAGILHRARQAKRQQLLLLVLLPSPGPSRRDACGLRLLP